VTRTPRLLAALAMVALITTGCANAPAGSGSNATTISGPTTAPNRSNALAGTSSSAGATPAATAPAGTDSRGGNPIAANREQAVKFAQCMRANGISEFPDPGPSGELTIDQLANGSSLDTNSAAFQQAISACKDLEPAGFTGSKRSPEQQKAALKFAQCIRDNGVKDFPDPDPDGPLVDTNRIPSAARNGGMSILHVALQKCRGLAANAGVTGGQ
jgi:hypothetical protein